MSTFLTVTIPETDCIGDSLDTINNNFDNLGTAVATVSTTLNSTIAGILTATDSSIIDLTYNSATRNLSADIINGSITTNKIAPGTLTTANISTTGFFLSATQIVGYSKGFKKFKFSFGDKGSSSYYRTNSFISNDNRLYVAGYAAGYGYGMGTGLLYADHGFHESIIPLDVGEFVVEHYMTGNGAPSMYVLTNLGNLYSVGYNDYGQLGDGTVTTRTTWAKIPITGVTHFSCSTSGTNTNHCLAVSNGSLYAWGYNGYGQLGDNTTTNRSTPTLISTGGIVGKTITKCFAFGDDYTSYAYSFVIDSDRAVYATGNNGAGQLGQGNLTQLQIFTVVPARTADYIVGGSWNSSGTSYLVDGNSLWVCGHNGNGQLGDGTTTNKTTFFQSPAIAGLAINSIAVCGYHRSSVIVTLTNRTVRTWGYNNYGQLGNGAGAGTNILSPFNPGLTNAIKVRGQGWDANSMYVLDSNGELWASGYNGYGQLGNGGTNQLNTFTRVIKNKNVKFVDFDVWGSDGVGGFTAADTNGDLYSCGYNSQHSCGIPLTNINNVTVIQRATIQ